MYSTAITAYPFSYSKVGPTFRTAGGIAPTARTYLGCESFTDFFIPRAFSNGFVREHCSEARPRCIKDRLCHLGFGKPGGINIPYCNVIKLSNDACRKFVEVVSTRIGDLGVYGLDQAFFTRTLGLTKFFFKFSVMALIGDFFASRQCGKVFQAKINSNGFQGSFYSTILNLDHDIQKPVAAPVTTEIGSIFDLPVRERSGIEYAEGVSCKAESASLTVQVASFERNPPKRLFPTPPQEWFFVLTSGLRVLFANGIDRAGMDTKFFGCASSQLVEIKACRPFFTPFEGLLLNIVTVVPYEIDSTRLAIENTRKRFYAIAIGEDHFCRLNQSSTARRISSETERPRFSESVLRASKRGCGRKKCVRFMSIYYKQMIVLSTRRGNQALSLPGLNAGVSRTIR